MKLASITVASAVGLSCILIPGCNPADPSAISESQKAVAEAMAKNIRLTEENAALKSEVEQAKADLEKAKTEQQAKPPKVDEPAMPSPAEVEAKLDKEEIAKLKELAKQKYPGAKVLGAATWDVTTPSDSPYSCKAKVPLQDANGTRRTLYWTGSATIKGEWKFNEAENLESKPPDQVAEVKTDPVANEPKKPEQPAGFTPPKLTVARDGEPVARGAKDVSRQPARPEPPAAPEKPKQKYDINFDKPVMGPGSR